ncbi:MAG: tail fiber domain-containing protein, partial [Flavobacteriaceae bacterium]|nr:tail fiber domain-containing protein [Flavobacteriaceae bacterium]
MKYIYQAIVFSLCFFQLSIAQVGVGNTNPKAILDISASNSVAPSSTDGILIPRIDAFPLTDPGADQNGMLVFLTTDNKFYYWHQGSTSWLPMASDKEWTDNGAYLSPMDGSTKDVSIGGNNNPIAKLTVKSDKKEILYLQNSSIQDTIMYGIVNSLSNPTTRSASYTMGLYNYLTNDNSGRSYGVYNRLLGDSDGFFYGTDNVLVGSGDGFQSGNSNSISNSGNGTHFGTYNNLSGSGDGIKYGVYNSISSAAGGLHYGVYSSVLKSDGYAGYFLGKVSIGTTTSNNYFLPTSRGTTGQVMQTDASGNLSWANSSTIGAQKINDLSDGKSDSDGSNDGSSIFLGINAGLFDDGSDNENVGVGYNSLRNNTTGYQNTALGYNSFLLNTEGSYNVSIGNRSLFSNTTGINNTAIGVTSLNSNIVGSQNTAIGKNALNTNKSGSYATAIGYLAMANSNSTSIPFDNYNTAVGSNALRGSTNAANNTGNNNTSLGSSTLFFNTTGSNNTATGVHSMISNTTGNFNIAIGKSSLSGNTDGNNNSAIGNAAGYNLTSGNNNTIIGGNTIAFPNVTGSNQLNIGNLIYGTSVDGTANTISTGKIGIGVKAPSEKFEINGAIKIGTTLTANSGTIRWTGTDFEGYNGSVWKSFTINPIDTSPAWYNEGTTTNATVSTSDITRTGNIGLGVTNANASLDILDDRGVTSINITTDDTSVFSNTDSHGIKINLDNDNNGLATGDTYAIENTLEVLTGTGYGIKNNLISNSGGSPTVYGSYQNIQGNALGSATGYGTYNIVDGNFSTSYGSYNRILGNGYGVYSSATNTSAFAGYFLGRLSIGTTTGNNYIMPASRGTNGQVIYTDGTGNLSWIDTTSFGVQKIDELSDGKSDTAGSSVFLGLSSGNVDDGSNNKNIGLGYHSLQVNTTGENNVALGHNSLGSNIIGTGNVGVGSGSLTSNKSGFNTAVGYYALNSNSDGDNNIAIGNQAMLNNSIGVYNIGLGSFSNLSNTSGSRNIAIGHSALLANTTGSNNIGIGYSAGDNLVTAGNIPASNIMIGNHSYAPDTSGSNQLNIGNLIYGTSLDGLGNTISSGNIGIGVKVPSEKLQVNGNIRMDHSSGNYWNTYVDGFNDYNFSYNGILKAFILDTDGSYNVTSDQKLKNNINRMNEDVISKVMQLNPVTYSYKNDL